MEHFKAKAYSLKGVCFGENIKNTPKNLTEENIERVIELENEIDNLKKDYEETKELITKMVNKIEDDTYRNILYCRYVCFEKWEDIAKLLNYSERWIYTLHNKALKEFSSNHCSSVYTVV